MLTGAAGRGSVGAGRQGVVASVHVSDGGVPKLPVASARVTSAGLSGDRQRDLRYHGGPDRAVCLFSRELLEALAAEGHPIAPGTIGENLLLSGLDWSLVVPGARLDLAGGPELEVTDFAAPCAIIGGSFEGGRFERISDKAHRGWSRAYCRVLREGDVQAGMGVVLRA